MSARVRTMPHRELGRNRLGCRTWHVYTIARNGRPGFVRVWGTIPTTPVRRARRGQSLRRAGPTRRMCRPHPSISRSIARKPAAGMAWPKTGADGTGPFRHQKRKASAARGGSWAWFRWRCGDDEDPQGSRHTDITADVSTTLIRAGHWGFSAAERSPCSGGVIWSCGGSTAAVGAWKSQRYRVGGARGCPA